MARSINETVDVAALVLALIVGHAVVFFGGGLRRTDRHRRERRSGQSRKIGPVDLVFAAGDVVYVLGPLTAVLEIADVWAIPIGARAAGLVIFVGGSALSFVAQRHMGAAWAPVGESNTLVTTGPFAHVRHPIYSALVAMAFGVALMIPTVVTLVALALFTLAVQLQARLIEERHWLANDGHYRSYATRTGRFVPRLGRLETPTA